MVADGPEILKYFPIFLRLSLVHNIFETYTKPLRNLSRTSNQNDWVKLEMIVNKNAMNNVGTMIIFLPRVSARKPQRCDETIIPMNPTALNKPLFWVVNFKSHSATGKIMLMLTVSRSTEPSMAPVSTIRI